MPSNRRLTIPALIAATCLSFGLAGCSSANSTDTPNEQSQSAQNGDASAQFTDKAGIEQEYRESLGKLEFPAGYTPPETMDNLTADQYEKGFGDTRASFVWECAWKRDWLDTYGTNPDEAKKALQQLQTAKDMPYMQGNKVDDAMRQALQEQLDKAALGDPSAIQQDVEVNCPADWQ